MQRHAPSDYDCPFCQIINKTEGNSLLSNHEDVICQNNKSLVLLSAHQYPNNHGNILVIPNTHFENIFELPDDLGGELHRIARMMAFALKEVFQCDGISTRQHNEPAGNQDVWHYHIHVTPRYKGDNFYSSKPQLMPIAERKILSTRIKSWNGFL